MNNLRLCTCICTFVHRHALHFSVSAAYAGYSKTDSQMSNKGWLRKLDSSASNGPPCSVRSSESAQISFYTLLSNAYVYGWVDVVSERRVRLRLTQPWGLMCKAIVSIRDRQRDQVQVSIHFSCHSQAYMNIYCTYTLHTCTYMNKLIDTHTITHITVNGLA